METIAARLRLALLLTIVLLAPAPAPATDVDGPNDCQRSIQDFGDAPEGALAYPGVAGRFPTCTTPGPVGTRTVMCVPLSTLPGPTGFVRHITTAANLPYWLGCPPVGTLPQGVDSENDGKMNATGAPTSACNTTLGIDCVEAAFGMSFGQDECYGSTDASIVNQMTFAACSLGTVAFKTYNCATANRTVFLNILVDWNRDGDWNDNFFCNNGCSNEWAVKNVPLALPPGCFSQVSPVFRTGPNNRQGWLRLTITDTAVTDDFPWAGSALIAGQSFSGGETEDYPVTVRDTIPSPCKGYTDFGDAPEEIGAYPTVPTSHFPTCLFASGPGTRDVVCAPISSVPGPTGYVEHLSATNDAQLFWLGCGSPFTGARGVDSEADGKTNPTGVGGSVCNAAVTVDCAQPAFSTMTFGQDECYGDDDAGVPGPITFTACTVDSVAYTTFNCRTTTQAFLNILVDWNEDADWNDNFLCGATGPCAYEWAVKNAPILLAPGCQPHVSPVFRVGPRAGNGWMRVTITIAPVTDDFPWLGSATAAGPGFFRGGETEDYPITITTPPVQCPQAYRDFGDAPEGLAAYSTGIVGRFPTCLFPTAPGSQNVDCPPPLSTLPGPTGAVIHNAVATDQVKYWLGCGTAAAPGLGIDSENDGKFNTPAAPFSFCNDIIPVDCAEAAFGMTFGQDECYGTPDAALGMPVAFAACSLQTVTFLAYNCTTAPQQAVLNVLVDWNADGDWNDNLKCDRIGQCAPEWVVKNRLITLTPGCATYATPRFRVGPRTGPGWMRITLSEISAPDDYPWNGTLGIPGGAFARGETEDYPVRIDPSLVGVGGESQSDVWFAPIVPNPSREASTVSWTLPTEQDVEVAVYDVVGRSLRTLARGRMPAGQQSVRWDFRDASGRAVPPGLYLVKLRVGAETFTRRVIHMP